MSEILQLVLLLNVSDYRTTTILNCSPLNCGEQQNERKVDAQCHTFYFTERPREFLIDQLEKLKESKHSQEYSPCLFNESNLDALFGILDPSHQGYITHAQYKEGKH